MLNVVGVKLVLWTLIWKSFSILLFTFSPSSYIRLCLSLRSIYVLSLKSIYVSLSLFSEIYKAIQALCTHSPRLLITCMSIMLLSVYRYYDIVESNWMGTMGYGVWGRHFVVHNHDFTFKGQIDIYIMKQYTLQAYLLCTIILYSYIIT